MSEPPSSPRARPVRRAPTDLSFQLDDALVEAFAAEEPAWSGDDRRAALGRYRELPVESNRLYTTYVDLRAAALEDVLPAYRAAIAAPSTTAESAATADVTITLVRWPFT